MKKFLLLALTGTLIGTVLAHVVPAQIVPTPMHGAADVLTTQMQENSETKTETATQEEDQTQQNQTQETAQTQQSNQTQQPPEETFSCQFIMPAKPQYKATHIMTRKKGLVAQGELFETEVYIRNEGNTPWFSADSGCHEYVLNLGTERQRDRASQFFTENLLWEAGWLTPERVKIQQKRVNPGDIATFTFWSKAPQERGLFREYFMPVLEGVTWIEDGLFHFDIVVEDDEMEPEEKEFLEYIQYSGNLSHVELNGEKSIYVSINQQRAWLKVGETVIREFPVSTGTYRTPTPHGTTKIMNKQLVRVGSARPHYIMPYWMQFRAGGYGFHALPSLANDGGVFWREALDHIGTRRSHGCIRMLPEDAEFTYGFSEVGMSVVVGA